MRLRFRCEVRSSNRVRGRVLLGGAPPVVGSHSASFSGSQNDRAHASDGSVAVGHFDLGVFDGVFSAATWKSRFRIEVSIRCHPRHRLERQRVSVATFRRPASAVKPISKYRSALSGVVVSIKKMAGRLFGGMAVGCFLVRMTEPPFEPQGVSTEKKYRIFHVESWASRPPLTIWNLNRRRFSSLSPSLVLTMRSSALTRCGFGIVTGNGWG